MKIKFTGTYCKTKVSFWYSWDAAVLSHSKPWIQSGVITTRSNITWYFMQHWWLRHYINQDLLSWKTPQSSPVRASWGWLLWGLLRNLTATHCMTTPSATSLVTRRSQMYCIICCHVLMGIICKASFHQELFHAMLQWLSHTYYNQKNYHCKLPAT